MSHTDIDVAPPSSLHKQAYSNQSIGYEELLEHIQAAADYDPRKISETKAKMRLHQLDVLSTDIKVQSKACQTTADNILKLESELEEAGL